jgi:transcriptional regulator with XRE-family HTH domain
MPHIPVEDGEVRVIPMGKVEKEAGLDSTEVPGEDPGLGARIRQLLDLYPDRRAAAEVAGKSVDMLTSYMRGRVAPSFDALSRLADAKGVSLDWLASGEGAMLISDREYAAEAVYPQGGITPELIREVALFWIMVNEVLDQPRPPSQLADSIADQCRLMHGEGADVTFFVNQLKENISAMQRSAKRAKEAKGLSRK